MRSTVLLLLLACLASPSPSSAQVFFNDCAPTAGENSNVIIRTSAPSVLGEALIAGDEVAVFNTARKCVGATVWDPALPNNSFPISGNEAAGGMVAGDPLEFRIRRSAALDTFRAAATYSDCAGPCVLDGLFAVDKIYFVTSLIATPPALSVELTSFEGMIENNRAELRWTTATETINAGFEVLHSLHEDDFQTVGFVEGAGTTTEPRSYSFTTYLVAPGANYFRLKQIDLDGSFAYSPIIEVYRNAPERTLLESPFPNPFRSTTTLTFTLVEEADVRLTVYDALGRPVRTLFEGRVPALTARRVRFAAGDLPNGMYLYRLEGANGLRRTGQMVLHR